MDLLNSLFEITKETSHIPNSTNFSKSVYKNTVFKLKFWRLQCLYSPIPSQPCLFARQRSPGQCLIFIIQNLRKLQNRLHSLCAQISSKCFLRQDKMSIPGKLSFEKIIFRHILNVLTYLSRIIGPTEVKG